MFCTAAASYGILGKLWKAWALISSDDAALMMCTQVRHPQVQEGVTFMDAYRMVHNVGRTVMIVACSMYFAKQHPGIRQHGA